MKHKASVESSTGAFLFVLVHRVVRNEQGVLYIFNLVPRETYSLVKTKSGALLLI